MLDGRRPSPRDRPGRLARPSPFWRRFLAASGTSVGQRRPCWSPTAGLDPVAGSSSCTRRRWSLGVGRRPPARRAEEAAALLDGAPWPAPAWPGSRWPRWPPSTAGPATGRDRRLGLPVRAFTAEALAGRADVPTPSRRWSRPRSAPPSVAEAAALAAAGPGAELVVPKQAGTRGHGGRRPAAAGRAATSPWSASARATSGPPHAGRRRRRPPGRGRHRLRALRRPGRRPARPPAQEVVRSPIGDEDGRGPSRRWPRPAPAGGWRWCAPATPASTPWPRWPWRWRDRRRRRRRGRARA